MRTGGRAILALGIAFWAAGCRTLAPFDASRRRSLAESVIADWTRPSRLLAARLIEAYGPPDAISAAGLGWKDRARWKRIVLLDVSESYVAEQGTADSLEQTIAYLMPEGGREAVAAFRDDVRVSADGTEMTARSGDESRNRLALNLADQVARGVRDPADARFFYGRTVELAASGKSSPYLEELLFPARP